MRQSDLFLMFRCRFGITRVMKEYKIVTMHQILKIRQSFSIYVARKQLTNIRTSVSHMALIIGYVDKCDVNIFTELQQILQINNSFNLVKRLLRKSSFYYSFPVTA
jgi:hypothetical protein